MSSVQNCLIFAENSYNYYAFLHAQITREQCVSIYFGEWAWKEIHLVSSSAEKARIWQEGLQSITDHLNGPTNQHSTFDYWLRCMYLELRRQNDGRVHAVTVFST